jgi:hypothetical protein
MEPKLTQSISNVRWVKENWRDLRENPGIAPVKLVAENDRV